MDRVFVAGKPLKIGQKTRRPGEPVPEALFFRPRIRKAMLNTGHLKEVFLADLSESQQEKLSILLDELRPKHIGGGVYLLPDGRKVKGKADAYAAMVECGIRFADDQTEAEEDKEEESESEGAD